MAARALGWLRIGLPRRVLHALRRAWAAQAELHERHLLALCPWEELYLHWAPAEDGEPRLHGRYLPPPGRRRSTTRSGWCLAADRDASARRAES
jgi:hypothetical protein